MSALESIVRQIVGGGIRRAMGQEQHLRARRRLVRRSELGDEWPLTVDEAMVHCDHNAVYLTVNGKIYWVNAWAQAYLKSRGVEAHEVNEIWATAEESFAPMKNIGPLINLGRSICDDDPPARFSRDWWRIQLANALSFALKPLILVANFLSFIARGLIYLIARKGGGIVKILFFSAGLGLMWLTTGIFVQEIYEGIEGFWKYPFLEHGIYYVIAIPFTIAILMWVAGSHRRE